MTYFQAYILHCHGPTGFALGKVKEILSRYKSQGSWHKNIILILLLLLLLLVLGIYEKINTSTFGCTVIPLAPRSVSPNKGNQRFFFFK
jgi:hypothetical protein